MSDPKRPSWGEEELPDVPMRSADEPTGWFFRKATVRWIVWGLALLSLAALSLDFLFHPHFHFHSELEEEYGKIAFYSLYGFVSCTVIVLLGRALRRLVMREEDYYE